MRNLVNDLEVQATRRSFKKGTVLLYQGEVPRMAYVIKSGTVKVYTINNGGEEQIVTFHGDNDFFPSPWVFGKSHATLYYYEAFSDCVLLTLPRENLLEFLYKPEHIRAMADYFIKNYTGMLMRVTALEQSRAREKIMFTLYYLLFRYGEQKKGGNYAVSLPLTHSALASLMGLTRETTTTELNKLKKEKIVKYNRHSFIVHKQKLERALGEDSFNDLNI
jgi:CRP/FNR family cyclic AMP-dependent transcriptional regulator